MSGGRWHEARKAWGRLSSWDDASDARRDVAEAPRHDRDALEALCDIGFLRRLLDEAELSAVRVARRQRRSWAEIATMLGVTRQSAWERWRDLDETPDDTSKAAALAAADKATEEEIVANAASGVVASAASELTDWAKRRRRKASVIVPRVVGMRSAGACAVLEEHGLVPVGLDPDGVRYDKHGWPDRVVTNQSPESGAKVPPGSSVRLWLERGGGAGVREPRRPNPAPRSGREMRPEPISEPAPERADEAVG